MRFFTDFIERFTAKHRRFGIPRLMMYIIIGQLIAFLIIQMDQGGTFAVNLLFVPSLIAKGQIWRLISWVFIPAGSGNVFFFALSLYFYYFLGSTLENQWGTGTFTIYYLTGIVAHIIFGFIVSIFSPWVSLTAVYLNMALFLAVATLFPDARVLLFFFIPVKMKWLAFIDGAFIVFTIFTEPTVASKLLPVIGVLNYLLFFANDLLNYVKTFLPQLRAHRRLDKHIWQDEPDSSYSNPSPPPSTHNIEPFAERVCAVCGKSAAEHPELEFRYCSQCTGLHCFCMEHINSHVHFEE